MNSSRSASSTVKCKHIQFIRANPATTVLQTSVTESSSSPTICGKEVRSFYETLLAEPSTSAVLHNSTKVQLERVKNNKKYRRKFVKLSKNPVEKEDDIRKNSEQLFKDATNGNLRGVMDYYCRKGIDIDVSDQYGWTALMCASYAGYLHIVKYLLSIGVNISKRAKSGETAADFALKCGHHKIYRQIILHEKEESEIRCEPILEVGGSRKVLEVERFCDACQCTYIGKAHLSSIAHLLEIRKPVLHPGYGIPEWNKGYRILRKSGWDDFEGLGRHATGRRYPIKAILKKDKLGLGFVTSDKSKANDVNAVKVRPTAIGKDIARKRILHEKTLERRFRSMFRDN